MMAVMLVVVMVMMMVFIVMSMWPAGYNCQGLPGYKSCLFRPNISKTTRSAKVLWKKPKICKFKKMQKKTYFHLRSKFLVHQNYLPSCWKIYSRRHKFNPSDHDDYDHNHYHDLKPWWAWPWTFGAYIELWRWSWSLWFQAWKRRRKCRCSSSGCWSTVRHSCLEWRSLRCWR